MAFRPPKNLEAAGVECYPTDILVFIGLSRCAGGVQACMRYHEGRFLTLGFVVFIQYWSPEDTGRWKLHRFYTFCLLRKACTWGGDFEGQNSLERNFSSLPKLELSQNRIIFTLSNPITLWPPTKTYSVFIVPLFELTETPNSIKKQLYQCKILFLKREFTCYAPKSPNKAQSLKKYDPCSGNSSQNGREKFTQRARRQTERPRQKHNSNRIFFFFFISIFCGRWMRQKNQICSILSTFPTEICTNHALMRNHFFEKFVIKSFFKKWF